MRHIIAVTGTETFYTNWLWGRTMAEDGVRELLGSRLGFLLLSAGCAIGLGNVWKFPYMVGQNGGGMFVLIYIVFLVLLGIPVLCMEFSIGRGSRSSPLHMVSSLEPEGSRWHYHGYMAFAGCFLLMAFYCVVAGWMLYYFVRSALGGMTGLDSQGVADVFSNLVSDPVMMIVCTMVVVVVGFAVCSMSLQKGLEKVTKFMMAATFVIMAFLVVYSLTLKGASTGLDFYLRPNLDSIGDRGLADVVVAAMSQAFFTLSIGIGSMAIFGSYVDKSKSLLSESVCVTVLDTVVALMAYCGR